MKKVLSILAFGICFLAFPAFAEKQDTLFFTYDENSHSLKISITDNTLNPFFLANHNAFAEKLAEKYSNGTYLHKDGYISMWTNGGVDRTIENVDWFDLEQCSAMVVHYYLYDQDRIDTGRKFVVAAKVAPKIVAEENTVTADEKGKTGGKLWLIVVLVVVVVVAAAVLLVLLKRRQKAPQKPQTTPKSKDNSLEVVEVVDDSLVNGLDAVRQDVRNYYVMDMQKDYKDTAVHKIYLHHTAVKKMYDFFKKALESSDQTTETGCYFVGCWEYADKENQAYNISVEDIVEPGDDIVSGEFSFNFGLKIGVKLFAKISELTKRTNRDFVHTVWMHSHPGLGLFLSSHDLQVQGQLTYSDHPKRLVAFVIDTNTPEWDLAVFTAKADGTMNNKDELTRLYSLEELYRWSRETHSSSGDTHGAVTETATEQRNMDDYYAVQVNHQGSAKTLNVYFSGRAINAIDDILYDCAGKSAVGGYVAGVRDDNGNIGIDDCQREPNPQALGLFVVDKNATDQTIATEYVKESPVLCVLVCRSEDELLMLTRNSAKEPFPPLADAAVCPMKPMKEWLRRRRVYK